MAKDKKKYKALADFRCSGEKIAPGTISDFPKLSDADKKMLIAEGYLGDIEVVVEEVDNSVELQKQVEALTKLNDELTAQKADLEKAVKEDAAKLKKAETEIEKLKKPAK